MSLGPATFWLAQFGAPVIPDLSKVRGIRARTLELSRVKEAERSYGSSVNALDVSQGDGKLLLSGGGDGSVVVHGIIRKRKSAVQEILPVLGKIPPNSRFAHGYAVSACQFYPHDPGAFTTAGKDGKVKIWDTKSMAEVHKFAFDLPVLDINMSLLTNAKPLIAVACMDKTARICDLRTISSAQTLTGHTQPVNCVRWSRYSPHMVATGGADGKIALWDVRKARSCMAYLDHNNSTWNAPDAGSLNLAHESAVISLEFAEDANHLISYGADNRLRLWSTVSGKNTNINFGQVRFAFRDLHRHLQICVSSLARPDLIFVPSDDKIFVFDMFSGEKVITLMAHFGQVLACAYHPNFQYLFSGATDRNLLLWAPRGEYKEYLEEQETEKAASDKLQLQKSNQRLAASVAKASVHSLQMDTWSDDET